MRLDLESRREDAGFSYRLVTALLNEIDGVSDRGGIFLVGCTSRIDDIDDALIRPGRFDRIVPVPSIDSFEKQISVLSSLSPLDPYSSILHDDRDVLFRLAEDALSSLTTPAQLVSLHRRVAFTALREWMDLHDTSSLSVSPPTISRSHIHSVLEDLLLEQTNFSPSDLES